MTDDVVQTMDENTRRYYLDAMGIQCWESLDAQQPGESRDGPLVSEAGNREVAANYTDMEKTIQTCTNCVLQQTRKQALSGRGNTSAKLMFVLLSPNETDESNDLLCSGEAGDLFGKMLAAININIDDVYITSLLKCKVPVNHTVSPGEIQSCNKFLKQQIQFVQPERVVVLGETTARCLLQKELSIDESRAMNESATQQLDSVPLFFSYAPEELLQQPENKRKAWTDLQQLQKIVEKNS
jgi:DNA polymerase